MQGHPNQQPSNIRPPGFVAPTGVRPAFPMQTGGAYDPSSMPGSQKPPGHSQTGGFQQPQPGGLQPPVGMMQQMSIHGPQGPRPAMQHTGPRPPPQQQQQQQQQQPMGVMRPMAPPSNGPLHHPPPSVGGRPPSTVSYPPQPQGPAPAAGMGLRPPQTPGPQLPNGHPAPAPMGLATPQTRPISGPPQQQQAGGGGPGRVLQSPMVMTGGPPSRPQGPGIVQPQQQLQQQPQQGGMPVGSFGGGYRGPVPPSIRPMPGSQLPPPATPGGLIRPPPPGAVSGPPPSLGLQQQHQQQQQQPSLSAPHPVSGGFGGPPPMGRAMPGYSAPPPTTGGSGGGLVPQSPMQRQVSGTQPPSFGGPQDMTGNVGVGGGGIGAPVQPQSMSRNIDPGQMPRPPNTNHPVQVFETRRENTHNIPPPAEEPIMVRDTGNAGPRYMRSTLNAVPASADLLKSISLPLVLAINPLALPHPGDSPIEIVDMGPSGPLRCQQCKAYINPYMSIIDNARRMQCCFCKHITDIPPDAFTIPHAWQDPSGGQLRPELSRGSVEFVATPEYMVRPPAPPTFLFVIDVSAPAVTSGATGAVCASLAKLLTDLPGGDLTRVGIITFDTAVHFYSIQAGSERPRMLVMADVEEPYNPLGTRAVVNVSECKAQLESLLASIPTMFAQNQIPENCGGAAIYSAIQALKAGVGGRAVLFISSIPHKGAFGLKPREAGRPPGERDVLDIMNPHGPNYGHLANDAAENQVSVDVVALSQGYVDLATLSLLSTTTCGTVLRYAPFTPTVDAGPLHNDLRWSLMRPQGMEAVGRLRVSSGLTVEKYVGSFYKRSTTDVNLPAVHCDMSIAARVVHDERLAEGSEAYAQFALLYTTTEGQRRVRVHTLALPVTRSAGTVFRGADMDAYLMYVARKVSAQIPGRSLVACREAMTKAAVETLLAYRKQCASASSSGQLILPEALKLLPLYTLGLTKLPCFRTDARADARAMWMARLLSLPADKTVALVHPRLLPLHDLSPVTSTPEGEPVPLPDSLYLSAERLDPSGLYLMENGFEAYIYVGSGVTPDLCSALLGVPSVESVDKARVPTLPMLDSAMSKAAHRLLDEIRKQRCRYMRLRVLRRGDPSEAAFLASLVEDRSPSAGMSYVEFLCHLHRQIQNKLS